MKKSAIKELEHKLEEVVRQLKATNDPNTRRHLLAEMRILLSELDWAVFDSAKSYSAHPQTEAH
jgi:hypothetical protein